MDKIGALTKNLLYEKVAVIHNKETVAYVHVEKSLSDTDKLERAFMLTNSVNDAWWNNEEVTKMVTGACRSTSTGDMVVVGTKKYKCEAVGWKEVE